MVCRFIYPRQPSSWQLYDSKELIFSILLHLDMVASRGTRCNRFLQAVITLARTEYCLFRGNNKISGFNVPDLLYGLHVARCVCKFHGVPAYRNHFAPSVEM